MDEKALNLPDQAEAADWNANFLNATGGADVSAAASEKTPAGLFDWGRFIDEGLRPQLLAGVGADNSNGYQKPTQPQDWRQKRNRFFGDHDYTAGPNLICPASWGCSPELIGRRYSEVRHAVPGNWDPTTIQSGQIYTVRQSGFPVGHVKSYVGKDGFTINNVTQSDHILHFGWANRNTYRDRAGNWYSFTHGKGTNYYGGLWTELANEVAGPKIFNALDASLYRQLYKDTHH